MKKKSTLFGRKFLLCLSLITSLHFMASAQNFAYMVKAANGDTIPFLQYKPIGHDAPGNTRKYPVIIFLHGGGERSDVNTLTPGSPVWSLASFGPSRLVSQGNKMSFMWNSQVDSFIVLSPMCRNTFRTGGLAGTQVGVWPNSYVTRMIDYAKTLNIDTNRIYLTGLSFGGGGTWNYLSADPANAKKLAAAAAIASPTGHHDSWGGTPNGPQYVSDAKLPVWGFHAQDDTSPTQVAGTTAPVNAINSRVPAPQVKALMTIWATGSVVPAHTGSWPRVYNIDTYPYGSEGIVNIYEWFLGQNKSLAPNALPTANAGSDFSVSTNSATLTGAASSDAGGGIVRYVWRAISAPSGVALSSISIGTVLGGSPSTSASNLNTLGAYTFRLYVVDTRAGIDSNDVVVTVTAPPGSGKALTISSLGKVTTSGDVSELSSATKFTMEARFKYDSTVSGWTTIMRKMTSFNDRIMVHVGPSNNSIYVMVNNTANTYGYTVPNVVAPGTWYHVAAVYDGTQAANASRLKIYIDGVLQTLTFFGIIPTTTSSTNTAPFMAGGEPGCCYLNGSLDEVRVWNTPLSGATIAAWKDKALGACHPDAANLVLYWPLDNNTSSTVATAGLGTAYSGTINNAVYVSSSQATTPSGCSAAPTKAVTINSSNGRIETGDVTALKSASQFTLEAQFKYAATVSTYTTIFRKSTSTNHRIMMHVGPNNNSIHLVVANGFNSYGVTGANAVAPGTWYHAAVVFDGTQSTNATRLKLYLNGVLQTLTFSTDPIPTTTSSSNSASFMAAGETSCCFLNGTIDEVRVWSAALSSTTISDWKDQLLGSCHPNFANLVLYWPLNDDSVSTTATPELGTSYTGTITNGTYVSSAQATASSGCSPSPAVLSEDPAAVIDRSLLTGRLYPNPTEGTVKIELNAIASKSVNVNVLDMFGRYVSKTTRAVSKGQNQISFTLGSLRAGTYIVEIRDQSTILAKYKVVKR